MQTSNNNEDTTMMQDNVTSNFDTHLVTPDSLIRVKPAVTIHTFMIVLTLMFIFALAFVLGLDYFLKNSVFYHSVSLYPCLFDAKQAFCVAVKS